MRNNRLNVPIVVGITGHMDLIEEGIPKLRARVKEVFDELKQTCPNSDIYLMTGLAEGADMLVAEVAYECGVKVYAVLPYEKESYLSKSFKIPKNIEKFETLYQKADKKKTLITDKEFSTSEAYANLGIYLVKHANILLALWDGVDNGKTGGTSAIVKYAKEFKVENEFDSLDGNAIYHIKTPRAQDKDKDKKDETKNDKTKYELNRIYLGRGDKESFNEMLRKIDKTNQEMSAFSPKKNTMIEKFEEFFSKRAKKFQKRYNILFVLMMILSLLAITSMEIVHNFNKEYNYFLHIYVGVVILIFILYFFYVKYFDIQDNYVYSRGIAEALRVQKYWLFTSKEPQRAGDYYLSDNVYSTVWIRNLLKNIYFLVIDEKRQIDLASVNTEWIDGQINYYKKGIKERERSFRALEISEKGFYILGLIVTGFMYYYFLTHNHDYHKLLFASAILFVLAGFLGEKYITTKGYEEEIHNFELMERIFTRAKQKIAQTTDNKKIGGIIHDLGEKALEENSKWVVHHSKYRVKPIIE